MQCTVTYIKKSMSDVLQYTYDLYETQSKAARVFLVVHAYMHGGEGLGGVFGSTCIHRTLVQCHVQHLSQLVRLYAWTDI